MVLRPLRLLHAIHDFLPRHRAGSEIYAHDLCQELNSRHHVTVLAAEYDLARSNGHVRWRVQDGLPVVELVNNWVAGSFEETYRSPVITAQLERLLDVVQPDVLHLHSLLNLSFDLPALAQARGIPTVATLHDYTLVCPSGGQRVHRADDHLCDIIEPARCARCFPESPFYPQIGVSNLSNMAGLGGAAKRAASVALRRAPGIARVLAQSAAQSAGVEIGPADIESRLDLARRAFDAIDLVVAPSRSIANGFEQLGMAGPKVRILDHGFVPLRRRGSRPSNGPLRIGYVGTLVWHKGVHVLIDAVRALAAQEYEVQIFGDLAVSPPYSAELRTRAAGLPVRFMGEVDRDAIADAYAGLDVLVVSSLWPENSPLVIREAFMIGVPVVAARIGGMVDLVDEGRNGFLYDPRSSHDLSRVLRMLIDDRERLHALARSMPPVKSMEAHAREWEELYGSLVGTEKSAPGTKDHAHL